MSEPQTPTAFAAPDPAELVPLFPGYEIDGLIATGGMGAVYRAVQRSLERVVAIKILPHELSADAAFCAGFEAEAKAMARLNHPNLIGVYDFGEVAGMLYIIMEYVPGQSLFHSAHGIAIDPAEVIRLIAGICSGLAHAHENGIIHRDIKPSNILLDLTANPKIGDFGLARPADRQIQEGEEIFGTPHYTAPEVVNSPGSVNHRADIFSVGVMLHELLTGRLPAEDQRPASIISHCDPRFDAIIRRATDPIPARRYSSALELASDLRTITTSVGPKVHRPNPAKAPMPAGQRKRKSAQRPKKSSAAPFIGILLIAAAIAALTYKHLSDQKAAKEIADQKAAATAADAPAEAPPADVPEPPPATPNLEPVPLPQPEPETPADTTLPAASPVETATPEPKFDVPTFLSRARKIMHTRAEPIITNGNENLAKNLADFERNLKRALRKFGIKPRSENVGPFLKDFIAGCENDGNRISPTMPESLKLAPDFDALHAEFLKKQEAIDSLLVNDLSKLSATYILGMEKQIERLKPTDDPAAVNLLEEEIKLVLEDEKYFTELMLAPDASAGNP
jgi:hypothetical protein